VRSAAQIEQLPIKQLRFDPRNTRTHSESQVAHLMASLREFGFTNPVLIDEHSQIIAGHGRVTAAKKLGMQKVPCIRIDYMTEAQKRAYVIADNKLAEEAGWDVELLKVELGDLAKLDFNIDAIGFDLATLTDDLKVIEKEQKNKQPEVIDSNIHVLADEMNFVGVGQMEFPAVRLDMILEVPDKLSIWCGADMSDGLPPPYFYNFGSDSTRGMPFDKTIVGFYVDDYRFDKFWDTSSASTMELVKQNYMGAVMPNYSPLITDPRAVRVFQMYKSRWVGRYFQEAGIKIVPDIQCVASDLEYLCDGLMGVKTIAIQAHQNYNDLESRTVKATAIDYAMEQLKPDTVLFYAPEKSLQLFPSVTRARVVRVEPRMHMKTARKKALQKTEVITNGES